MKIVELVEEQNTNPTPQRSFIELKGGQFFLIIQKGARRFVYRINAEKGETVKHLVPLSTVKTLVGVGES